MSITEEPMVSKKATFRIFIDGNGVIQIEDGDGKRGGSVDAKQGRPVSWLNDTGGECTLSFFRKLDESDANPDPAAWPFKGAGNAGSNAQKLPAARVSGQNPWKGILENVSQVTSYEYKIEVLLRGKTLVLDPMIIVRP